MKYYYIVRVVCHNTTLYESISLFKDRESAMKKAEDSVKYYSSFHLKDELPVNHTTHGHESQFGAPNEFMDTWHLYNISENNIERLSKGEPLLGWEMTDLYTIRVEAIPLQ